MEAKGGQDSFYAVDYAARIAMEMGADVVKLEFAAPGEARLPAPWTTIAGRVATGGDRRGGPVGGPGAGGRFRRGTDWDEEMLEKARAVMEAGATGVIFGRNVWQRSHDESLRFAELLGEILAKYPSP